MFLCAFGHVSNALHSMTGIKLHCELTHDSSYWKLFTCKFDSCHVTTSIPSPRSSSPPFFTPSPTLFFHSLHSLFALLDDRLPWILIVSCPLKFLILDAMTSAPLADRFARCCLNSFTVRDMAYLIRYRRTKKQHFPLIFTISLHHFVRISENGSQ